MAGDFISNVKQRAGVYQPNIVKCSLLNLRLNQGYYSKTRLDAKGRKVSLTFNNVELRAGVYRPTHKCEGDEIYDSNGGHLLPESFGNYIKKT